MIDGLCEDDITKKLLLKPATIEGTYQNETIYFIKRYPCLVESDTELNLKAIPTEPSPGIEYKGNLHRRMFSKKRYFKGKWEISGSLLDENKIARYYTIGGNWFMKKIE